MIKAIETQYKGYRFRSRLEAHWAVYFDAMKIEWDYELEGFDLGSLGYYLPDFWLSGYDAWAEVKPGKFNEIEIEKAKALATLTGKHVIMLEGIPEEDTFYSSCYPEGKPSPLWFTGKEPGATAARSARFEHGEALQ